ncbi:MAG: undecaprenyldiphospho-muramoylpentapeptide beta-N-acetylglucosaminyltransferase [Clostridiales bacterium]|nr:undecaprenyldiphospho-muramoylpentapeptide beta-N-acetylglucosaminyltransferase [Clostridiales bacterium]
MKVLIAGGGTAGHINPGLAIADGIKSIDKNAEIIFAGTKKGLEKDLVPKAGYELRIIKVRGFARKLTFHNVLAVKDLLQGLFQAIRLIKEFSPDIVIGTGGYVCGPVVLTAACLYKIPTLIHEQNAFPGKTIRWLSRFADITAISFRESEKYLKKAKKLVFTGNPVRSGFYGIDKSKARLAIGIGKYEKVVIIMGGSRGAGNLNEKVFDMMKKYYKDGEFLLYWSTGDRWYHENEARIAGLKLSNDPRQINIAPYIYNTTEIYPVADIMVCRAGAITLAELAVVGLPSILVPSPFVAENHQEYNARAMEKAGGAVLILEKELSAENLYFMIIRLLSDLPARQKMAKAAETLSKKDAAEVLRELVLELVHKTLL